MAQTSLCGWILAAVNRRLTEQVLLQPRSGYVSKPRVAGFAETLGKEFRKTNPIGVASDDAAIISAEIHHNPSRHNPIGVGLIRRLNPG